MDHLTRDAVEHAEGSVLPVHGDNVPHVASTLSKGGLH